MTVLCLLAWLGILVVAAFVSILLVLFMGLQQADLENMTFACTFLGWLGGVTFTTIIYLFWRFVPELSSIWEG